jgi:hypothetical protein
MAKHTSPYSQNPSSSFDYLPSIEENEYLNPDQFEGSCVGTAEIRIAQWIGLIKFLFR